MSNLEFVSTDDLIAELQRRFSPYIFIGEPVANKEPPTKMSTRISHRGEYTRCLGLAELLKYYVIRDKMKGEQV